MSENCRLRFFGCFGNRAHARDVIADLVEETVDAHVDADADSAGEAKLIRAAMTFDGDAIEAQEHRAIVAAHIETVAQFRDRRLGKNITESREQRAREGGADKFDEE